MERGARISAETNMDFSDGLEYLRLDFHATTFDRLHFKASSCRGRIREFLLRSTETLLRLLRSKLERSDDLDERQGFGNRD